MDLYKQAGVDIAAGNAAANRYKALAKKTKRSGVLGQIGGFASGFALDLEKYPEPVLVSGTDGVGTKLKVAFAANKHDSVGVDCVAMCVNDILTVGAEPLYFLDYLATGKLDVDVAESVVSGIARGCELAGAALVGGETAEMPGMYEEGEYDIAGFTVGVVNRPSMITGDQVQPGDVILGLASSGLHSNGYSLVRKLIADAGLGWSDVLPGDTVCVADRLLTPTRIYVKPILQLLAAGLPVHAMAHITGGGLNENLPRVLPEGTAALIDAATWPREPVFTWLLEQSEMTFTEATRVWNMGIGYVVVTSASAVDQVTKLLEEQGETVYRIGEIVAGTPDVYFR
ncbi:phosphoribosylformylglycinamidine cyclo-ligase [Alicyclobacillus acidoterrestris]|uniref:Phosphoribosylformylglycinamidine cyclo-ligase n=1 Tax=Alicyclobacillus acidoterrestris (strain ATCC 49025 / DSM 3922 / CIP 106132 / NCIMB 13137 / GD3B) TaxID=1356854 RepID=T0CNB4_ALIAG|nr:phosphoribosylformylglycinamidine cyclo-ligase [Alicyclobacillus acidoterrestris]EPZ40952.1 phosphoribosylaminoimidazole synthetase [Alicyclobacillus acidoterrestris ATCC 49025]UNO49731.1 phosphoribosylformylglycinamidine cyclo-ligase [Alicyclobacillus acidoterrestris]